MISFVNKIAKNARRQTLMRMASCLVDCLSRDARSKRTMLHRLFSRHLSADCRVLVDFDDHRFVVDPKDTAVSFALMNGDPWQREELEQAVAILRREGQFREGGAFVDVGANIGTQSVYALLSGNFSRTVSVEPAPANFELLRRNIALNDMIEQATLINAAASNCDCKVEPESFRIRLNRRDFQIDRILIQDPCWRRRPA